MGEFVGAFAASHAPLIARDWDKLPEPLRDRFTRAYRAVGARIEAARPDVLMVVSPDHWVNFFLDNLPAICIGVGDENEGPPEPFMAGFPHRPVPGAPALGAHLLREALAHDFDPSSSHRLILDHGFCIPLWKMALEPFPAILPVVVNGLEPPMLSLRRCAAWGRMIVQAVASFPGDLRVALLATGGLSHSIGEATMGAIDEAMDRRVIALLQDGDVDTLADYLERTLPVAGNGGHELRNWMIAHGAAGGRGFALIDYFPAPEVYVGCAYAAWAPEFGRN
jgi:aromatic ring-opening dioxygenase catalytic subunit (LigB family)